jgi:RNA polymerase sigma-B factor
VERDVRARDALVETYAPLARNLARRYRRSSEPLEDLEQIAYLGLVKALERFDFERGTSFQSFAVPTILGEMRRYFRDCGWSVHVPRGAQERALKVRDAQRRLTHEYGQEPTVARIAEYLEFDLEDVVDALYALRSYDASSLDAEIAGGDGDSETYIERLGAEDANFELVELSHAAAAALRELPERDRQVLKLRFVDELTQTEIATRIGVSQMQVSRMLRRSLERLRAVADAA